MSRRALLSASGVLGVLWLAASFVGEAASAPSLHRFALPSLGHPLGTDVLGRDIAARLLVGARSSFTVVGGGIALSLLLAAVFASPALAFAPGRGSSPRYWYVLDALLLRFADTLRAVPRVLLVIALVGLLASTADESRALWRLTLLLGGTGWMPLTRLLRELADTARREPHVHAAEALGLPRWRVFSRHMLPMMWPSVAVWLTASVGELIVLEAGLSYLGVGVPVTMVSWGTILRDAGDVFGTARWLMVGPGLVIGVAVAFVQWAADAMAEQIPSVTKRYSR